MQYEVETRCPHCATIDLPSCRFVRAQRHLNRLVHEENAQVLPWVVLLMFFFLGMSALVVDVGHAVLVKRQLQASADAAALAGAETLPASNWRDIALSYTAAGTNKNAYRDFSASVVTPVTIKGVCSTTVQGWGYTCDPSDPDNNPNVVSVTETATIPMFFTQYIGMPTMRATVTSWASKGAQPLPYSLIIALDTTPSMDTPDPNCKDENGNAVYVNGQTATQLQCAELGVQVLLKGLNPAVDRVSLFTFPNVTQTSVANDLDCSSNTNATATDYTFPSSTLNTNSNYSPGTSTSTYQIVDFQYQSSSGNTGTNKGSYQSSGGVLNTSSPLAKAVGAGSGSCTGMQTTDENTYFAGVLYAAEASLIHQHSSYTSSKNVIILLSDGNATAQQSDMTTPSNGFAANGKYPSYVGECGQAVDAANAIKAFDQSVQIFTVGYGSSTSSNVPYYTYIGSGKHQQKQSHPGNCASDVGAGQHPNISPCETLREIASDSQHFFSDYYDPTNGGANTGCQAAGPAETITSLSSIFKLISSYLYSARLIPVGTA